MVGQADRQKAAQTNGGADRQMIGRTDRQAVGQTDRQNVAINA